MASEVSVHGVPGESKAPLGEPDRAEIVGVAVDPALIDAQGNGHVLYGHQREGVPIVLAFGLCRWVQPLAGDDIEACEFTDQVGHLSVGHRIHGRL